MAVHFLFIVYEMKLVMFEFDYFIVNYYKNLQL